MQFHPNELFLVYDPHSNVGKQTRAIARDICAHINEVDVIHEINMAGVHPNDLLDHSHPDYKAMVSTNTFTMDGWLEVLVHDAHLIKYPIVIFNGCGVVCHTPTDIMKIKPKPIGKVLPHLKDSH